ncbi:unnamed protein product, partial [marine sediment metagenome]
VLWSGAIVDIPAGWALCDGNNGTPDLRNRFVIGAGDTYAPDATGGSAVHTHDFTSDAHDHGIPQAAGCPGAGPNPCLDGLDTNTEVATGTTDEDGVLPPYLALAYIMKVP